jgi:hypothetical protein
MDPVSLSRPQGIGKCAILFVITVKDFELLHAKYT